MNLAFATEELRTLCENQLAGERAFGMEVARQLRERLASMREAECLSDLLTGQPTAIEDGTRRCYEVHVLEDYRMVLCANHKPLPLLDGTGAVDWSRVTRILIRTIEKTEVARG